MKTRNNPWLRGGLLAASLVFTLSQTSHAQSVWTGSTDSVLSNGANYSPAIPTITAAGLNIQFNGTDTTTTDLTLATAMGGGTGTGGSTIAVLAAQTNPLTITGTAGSIRLTTTGFTVASSAGAVTFAGTGGFTIGGTAGNSTHTISNDSLNLLDFGVWTFGPGGGGTRTVSIGGSGNIQSSGDWTSSIILTKTGAGTLTLGGATARTGTTTITAGVLKLTNALALQNSPLVTSGTGTMTLNGITTLTLGGLSGSANLSSVITTGYGGLTDLTLNPGSGTQSYSGSIADGATGMNLVKSGAGTQVLSGASNYTGTTSVNGGTLRLSGSIGGAVSIAATAGIAGEGSINTGGSLTLGDGSTLTANGNTPSALSVGGNLAFGGNTNVILESVPASSGTASPVRLLDYTGTPTGTGTTFVLQNAANYRAYSFANAFATPNQVNMTIDTKSIVWSGGTAVWDIATTSNWDSGTEKFYQGDAVTFNDSGTTKAVTLAVSVLPASVLFDNTTGNDYTLTGAGAIAASAALTKSNSGTVTLSTPNTYSGGTTISGGKIVASVANALGTGGVTNNATLDLTGGAVTYSGLSTSMSGNGIVNVTLGTGSNSTALNGNYSGFTGNINIGVSAAIAAGKVQMTGADNALANVNVLVNGTLYVNANVTKNATVTLNGGDTGESLGQLRLETGANWAGKVILAGDITGTGDFTIGSGSGGGTISGEISETGGPRALNKGGSSTITLSGTNKYTGLTTVSAGTLKLGSAGALGNGTNNTSGVTVNGSSIFDLGGISPTAVVPLTLNSTASGNDVGSLNNSALGTTSVYSGAVTFQATTIMVGGGFTSPGANITLAGAITGNGKNLNKNGLGTLALSGGGTVALGVLQVNRGVIRVDSGTDLNVTSIDVGTGGSVGGSLTLNGGNVTSTGQSRFGQGTGTASGTLTLNSGILTVPALTKGTLTFNANFNGGTLKASAATTTFFAAATSAKVQAGGAFIDDGGFAITIAQPLIHDSALLTADGGLTLSGGGTLILSGANTYNGNTTVNAGTLELAASTGALKFAPGDNNISNKVTGAGTATFKGTFNIDLTNAAIADNNSWVLADVSSKSFDLTTFSVAGFTELPEGTWTLVDGSKTWTFTQSDATLRLDVLPGYANWLTLYPGILDPAAGADPENDGIENVLEYVLNGNPTISDPAILPDLDASGANFVFTFTRREESPTDTTQIFQYGTNLSGWTDVAITGTPGSEVTLGTPSAGLQTVTVAIPKSAAGPGGKLFGRLQAVKLP